MESSSEKCLLIGIPVSYTHLDVYKRQVHVLYDFVVHAMEGEGEKPLFLRCFSQSFCLIIAFRGKKVNGACSSSLRKKINPRYKKNAKSLNVKSDIDYDM